MKMSDPVLIAPSDLVAGEYYWVSKGRVEWVYRECVFIGKQLVVLSERIGIHYTEEAYNKNGIYFTKSLTH